MIFNLSLIILHKNTIIMKLRRVIFVLRFQNIRYKLLVIIFCDDKVLKKNPKFVTS